MVLPRAVSPKHVKSSIASGSASATPGRSPASASRRRYPPSILEVSAPLVSSYQFNPFGLDPLRDILTGEVDFARLRAGSPVQLVIAATRVKDGRPRLFQNAEITLDSVLASACMPLHHHAVEIDEEWYWDGGYSVNPPLRALVAESKADDVLLVQLTPAEYEGVPRTARKLRVESARSYSTRLSTRSSMR
jgi:NTE family protein